MGVRGREALDRRTWGGIVVAQPSSGRMANPSSHLEPTWLRPSGQPPTLQIVRTTKASTRRAGLVETIRARQIGPCFGVRDALGTVEAVLEEDDGRGITAIGHIVHNPQAMERLAEKGLAIDPDPSRPEPGGRLVITAHGAPPATFAAAEARGLEELDTTCPLVRRVHDAALDGAA